MRSSFFATRKIFAKTIALIAFGVLMMGIWSPKPLQAQTQQSQQYQSKPTGSTGSVLPGTSVQDTGSVVVHKDPRIDQLIKKRMEINEKTTRDNRRTSRGFRIQVINTRDRNEAIQAKTKMLQTLPEHASYIQYNAPFFKLKLGNFKTREEAEKVLKQVSRHYSTGVFIVSEMIEVKPEKPEEFE